MVIPIVAQPFSMSPKLCINVWRASAGNCLLIANSLLMAAFCSQLGMLKVLAKARAAAVVYINILSCCRLDPNNHMDSFCVPTPD